MKTHPLTFEQKQKLLAIAEETVRTYVLEGQIPDFEMEDLRLHEKEGAFVTLHKDGRLRGCIGHIISEQPLFKTVRDMAVASASQDQRFSPVQKSELEEIDVEISVLSRPWEVRNPDEIRMGVHGVIVSRGMFHRGIFLPQVATETGWSKEEFLSQLCSQKAGLAPDAWKDPATKLEVFTADVFSQHDLHGK